MTLRKISNRTAVILGAPLLLGLPLILLPGLFPNAEAADEFGAGYRVESPRGGERLPPRQYNRLTAPVYPAGPATVDGSRGWQPQGAVPRYGPVAPAAVAGMRHGVIPASHHETMSAPDQSGPALMVPGRHSGWNQLQPPGGSTNGHFVHGVDMAYEDIAPEVIAPLNARPERLVTPTAMRSGFKPPLPIVPERRPKSTAEVNLFVESLTSTDAVFEVVAGQSRLMTLRRDLAMPGRPSPVLAIGDPSIISLEVLPNPRLLRAVGLRPGITDVSMTTSDGETYTFQVQVVFDLPLVHQWLRQLFPNAQLKLSQFQEHVVVEGEARDAGEVVEILEVLRAYLDSIQANRGTSQRSSAPADQEAPPAPGDAQRRPSSGQDEGRPTAPVSTTAERTSGSGSQGQMAAPRIINRIRIPGPQQILLKVQVAELNRTALREIGTDLLFSHGGTTLGTQIGNAAPLRTGTTGTGSVSIANGMSLAGLLAAGPTAGATAFGIFEGINTQIFLSALRSNSILKILAEPNLVAMHGHKATFLAGGEFPIPVSQSGAGNAVTVQFREFGVRLSFEPYDLGDKRMRLAVSSEVSSVDFSLATTLVPQGQPVPGLSTRNVQTTVELSEGKTLMMAGLLQVTLDSTTKRIPGLGDLPTIGTLFRNNTGRRQEKELVVLVTPYLVEGLDEKDQPRLPGEEVGEPNDLDFYLRGNIEARCGEDFRSTTHVPGTACKLIRLEKTCVKGKHGYSE